jgi:hypothetical protein
LKFQCKNNLSVFNEIFFTSTTLNSKVEAIELGLFGLPNQALSMDCYDRIGDLIHIDLIGDKIWIQYDGTEDGVANTLVELGVPKQDIVLAYHSTFLRQYDGFAVG